MTNPSADHAHFQRVHAYFLGNISHEFKTPLASLGASLELLLDELDFLSTTEQRELLKSVQLSVGSLQTLVNNLLESTSIEAGQFVIRRQPLEMNTVLAEAVRIIQPLLDRRRQDLVLIQPFRLPLVEADAVRLVQLLVNLLSNASKYSPLGQNIDLGLDVFDENLLIAIADRGPGIPEHERADVFERFVRLAMEDSNQYGAGLGLSVAKHIVDGHSGTISIDDRPGGGAIFWITLPLKGK